MPQEEEIVGHDQNGPLYLPGVTTEIDYEPIRAEARRLAFEACIEIAREESANCAIAGPHPDGFRHACHAIETRIRHLMEKPCASSIRKAAEQKI